jgi:hypothetical protein
MTAFDANHEPLSRAAAADRGFSTPSTLLLALLLVFPLLVRMTSNALIYPALLFPGAGTVTPIQDGKAIVFYPVLWAKRSDGSLARLDARTLLAPMAADHLWAVIGTEFGQSTAPTKTIALRHEFGTFEIPRAVPDDASRRAAAVWLSDRVHLLQPDAVALIARTQRVAFDLAAGREATSETVKEQTFVLVRP